MPQPGRGGGRPCVRRVGSMSAPVTRPRHVESPRPAKPNNSRGRVRRRRPGSRLPHYLQSSRYLWQLPIPSSPGSPVKACLPQLPAPSSSIGVSRRWWPVIGWRRRIVAGRRTIRDGIADNSACGDAAENSRADGAADALCICRCWSDHGSDANARSANQRDERFVHVFSLASGIERRRRQPSNSPPASR